jgi:hypothetical protein
METPIAPTVLNSGISDDAKNVIEHLLKHETTEVLYTKEFFIHDGFDEFGPESIIACIHIIFKHPTYDDTPKYEYRVYYKNWIIGSEPLPIYDMAESIIYDKFDTELFDV